jgi:hypothetical protein
LHDGCFRGSGVGDVDFRIFPENRVKRRVIMLQETEETKMPHFRNRKRTQARPASRLALLKGSRRSIRYPISLNVRFQSASQIKLYCGAGVTRDFSSDGMFIETDRATAAPGAQLKIVADWPVLLGGTVPLQFVAVGQVVRCDAFGFAVRILRYEYRTRRREVIAMPSTTKMPQTDEAWPQSA